MRALACLVLAACASAPPTAQPRVPDKAVPLPTFQVRDAKAAELVHALAATQMDARGLFSDVDRLDAWRAYASHPNDALVESCLALLSEGDPRVRSAAAQGLPYTSEASAAYLLDALAREHHDGVALQLAAALGSQKLATGADYEAIAKLAGTLVTGAPVRQEAARVLMRAIANTGAPPSSMGPLILRLLETNDRELLASAMGVANAMSGDQGAFCTVLAKHFANPQSDDAWDAADYILTRAPARFSSQECERYVGDALDIAIDRTAKDAMKVETILRLDTARALSKGMRDRVLSRMKAIGATRPAAERAVFDDAITIYSQPRKRP